MTPTDLRLLRLLRVATLTALLWLGLGAIGVAANGIGAIGTGSRSPGPHDDPPPRFSLDAATHRAASVDGRFVLGTGTSAVGSRQGVAPAEGTASDLRLITTQDLPTSGDLRGTSCGCLAGAPFFADGFETGDLTGWD